MMLDKKVPLGSISGLCPHFKKKVLKKWMENLGKEMEELEEEAPCTLAQLEELPTTRDDNMAKINVTLANREMKGVILDGGS